MKKTIFKLILLIIAFLLSIVIMQNSVWATNENIEILEKSNGEYLIYIKDNLNNDFEFAFSNVANVDKNSLSYMNSETDGIGENANKIAYVNSITKELFNQPTYMWARIGTNYILEGVQVDLSKAMHEYNLQYVASLTKEIEVDTTKTNTVKKMIEEKEITKTVGKVILTSINENANYSYILVKLPNTQEYNKLMNLVAIVSKFNSTTNMYKRINVYKEFLNTFNNLIPSYTDNWIDIQENEILQPEDAEDGEQYILWIKESQNDQTIKLDIQFLTSHKKYSEEKIMETITTKLPITYDNNILLIALVILVLVSVTVYIRIKSLKNKEEK